MNTKTAPLAELKKQHFTLLELLIVIAIITILGAMLMPALSRARFAAMLANCAATQKQVAAGLTLSCMDNNRKYLERGIDWDSTSNQGHSWPFALKGSQRPFDIRADLEPFFSINQMACPLPEEVDFESSTATVVQWNYAIYAGWQLTTGEDRMKRLGDRMTQNGKEFDILVADHNEARMIGNDLSKASHPDFGTGTMKAVRIDSSSSTSSTYVFSSPARGPVDLNFARTDGSVFRIPRITVADTRLEKVDHKFRNNSNPLSDQWSLLPATDF